MGMVIRFPFERRDIWSDVHHEEPATVLILPTPINDEASRRVARALREAMDTVASQP